MKSLLYLLLSLFITGLTACSGSHAHRSESIDQQVYTLLEKGRQHEKASQIKEALVCYWDALDLLQSGRDTVLKAQTYNRLGDLLCSYGLYEKAVASHREGYNLARRLTDQTLLCETTRRLTLDYTLLNRNDTARYFLELNNRIARQNNLTKLLLPEDKGLGNLAGTLLPESRSNLYDRERLLDWEARYKQQKSELQAAQAETRKQQQLTVFLGTVLILLTLLAAVYRKKKKEQQRSLQASRISSEENRRLYEKLNYHLQQENKIKLQEEELRKREKALLSDGSTEVVNLLNRMKNTPTYQPVQNKDEWKLLKEFTEILYPGYADRLARTDGLTERDIELCYLTKLGFTTKQLAVFYGISPGSVTKAKFRLQKKLDMDECEKTGTNTGKRA
ncbi:hypothetical protein [uncultured Bacteroides sp.]|jgi:DNA-binding CsgD family transcriptional regulator|uniref:helix-turn-helix transcriptional regulator n=1 Tax=uncultured Bacteroides sp. TaxID=162156 RepID=UPI00280BF731|nr:hypothetical protein [uncultured Bacteroides sp.]